MNLKVYALVAQGMQAGWPFYQKVVFQQLCDHCNKNKQATTETPEVDLQEHGRVFALMEIYLGFLKRYLPATGQIISYLFLIDPQKSVKRQYIGVTNERQTVVTCVKGLAIRCNFDEESIKQNRC